MDHLLSQYIDDELSLDEKIDFLNQIRADLTMVETAVHLIDQERMLRLLCCLFEDLASGSCSKRF